MNFKPVMIIAIISVLGRAQTSALPEITSYSYSTVKSEYAISDKGLSRLYTPARDAVISMLSAGSVTNGDKGNITNSPAWGSPTYSQMLAITISVPSAKMSGPVIVLLEPYQVPLNVSKIGSNVLFNQVASSELVTIPIDPTDDYRDISTKAGTNTGVTYAGVKLYTDGTVYPGRYSMSGKTAAQYTALLKGKYSYGTNLLSLWQQFLTSEKFSYVGNVFWAKVGNGDVYPAIIHVFGTETKQYAMYGIWTREETALKYGYHKDDRIYMTAQKSLPGAAGASGECTAASEMGITAAPRYGEKTYHYEEIMADKTLRKSLAYAIEPVNSGMAKKVYDATGIARTASGIEIPNAPDNLNNDNGLGLEDCPDKDWYWGLFCSCASAKVNPTLKTIAAAKFNDYRDYADKNLNTQQYDPTIYGEDGSVSPLEATPDNPPVEPYLFNKDCVLLNKPNMPIYDPFATDATFTLREKLWEWDGFTTGWKGHDVDVKADMVRCLGELEKIYNYYIVQNKKTECFRSSSLGNQKSALNGYLDVTVFPTYKDSAWYVANPFNNYDPFEDFHSFAVYDNNTAAGNGPFALGNYQSGAGKGDDWMLFWSYPIIMKDKWGRKVSVGVLQYETTLLVNATDDIINSGEEFAGNKYNIHVSIGGSSILNSQNAYFNKNSQDYRTDQADIADRNKEEFEKAEALRVIARKILVAESYNLVMKTMYSLAKSQKNAVGATSGVLYEASKRVEARLAQSIAYKLAMETYEGFKLWRQTMDVLAKIRNTYMKIGTAWDGVLYSVHSIADYYKNLDLTKIRLTNITDIFPASNFADMNWQINSMQYALGDFNAAVHAMCLESDSLTHGNYGPLNPIIRVAYTELNRSVLQTSGNTTDLLDRTNSQVQALGAKSQKTSSDQAYLSNITRSTYNIISNDRIKVLNNGTSNLALALYMTETEAKSWVAYSRYMQMVVKDGPKKILEAGLDPTSDNWAAAAWMLHQDDIFDRPGNSYFNKLEQENSKK